MPSTLWCSSGQDLEKCDAYEQLDFITFYPRTKRNVGKLKGRESLSLTGSLNVSQQRKKS